MLKEKKGVLATRSPHRPNPVGVTLARIERVDKKTRSVLLSACDLVHGTPVLDIKPYVPNYDTVEPCKVPSWIVETINTRNKVIISQEARDMVLHKHLNSKLKLYKNDPELFIKGKPLLSLIQPLLLILPQLQPYQIAALIDANPYVILMMHFIDELISLLMSTILFFFVFIAIEETLEADVRSKFQTKRRLEDCKRGVLVEVPFDCTMVKFMWREERVLEVMEVTLN